jgi:F0F1-type ATP synthase membrane subunit a
VTGNLGFTAVLALITFIVVTINGNKHYWSHIVWMPGVPAIIKILILTPVEILGMFIKPFTLMLRLFANITAGHIVVMAFVGLIFMFGKLGESIAGGGRCSRINSTDHFYYGHRIVGGVYTSVCIPAVDCFLHWGCDGGASPC